MTQNQKIIRGKVGALELAKQLGNVSQACKMMGFSRDSFSMSSVSIDSYAGVIETTSSLACGQANRPRSRRLA